MKKLRFLLLLGLATQYVAYSQSNPFAGGSGTLSDPYQVSTTVQLDSVRNFCESNFILVNDIDLGNYPYEADSGWAPIGTESDPFTGIFNGHGHTISNLYINYPSTSFIGLFGVVDGGIIDSVGIRNCNVEGLEFVGGLVGYNNGIVAYCYSSGFVTGHTLDYDYGTGGLVGFNDDTVAYCNSSATVKGNYDVGGLVGTNYSTIAYSYSSGDVTGDEYIGGLIGGDNESVVVSSYSTSNVKSLINESSVGGLIGWTDGFIRNCYATGSVSGYDQVGGLFGYVNQYAGIKYCYSAGRVNGTFDVGGMAGWEDGELQGCYLDWQASGQNAVYGYHYYGNVSVEVLNTSELKKAENLDSLNFDTVWMIRNDSTYPGLQEVDNNAPFAFQDSLEVASSVNLNLLLENDFDLEKIKNSLVVKVDSLYGIGTTDGMNWYAFPDTSHAGSIDSLSYRVGEILPNGDTLWGSHAVAIFVKIENTAPDANNDLATVNENEVLILAKSLLLNNDTDPELDVVIFSKLGEDYPHQGVAVVSGSNISYTPEHNWSGTDTLLYVVSDGQLTDSAYVIITVVDIINSIGEINSGSFIYPNPASEGFYIQQSNACKVSVYSSGGLLLLSQNANESDYIDIHNLPDDLYFVVIDGKIFKLIKRK